MLEYRFAGVESRYLSATINLWKEPLMLKKGETLKFRYGAALWDEKPKPAAIARLRERWVDDTQKVRSAGFF